MIIELKGGDRGEMVPVVSTQIAALIPVSPLSQLGGLGIRTTVMFSGGGMINVRDTVEQIKGKLGAPQALGTSTLVA